MPAEEIKSYTIVIYGKDWTVNFVPGIHEKLTKEKYDGLCYYNELAIYISNDILKKELIRETLMHELTHAVLCSQGRFHQKRFDAEDMCEFVGWNADLIIELADDVMRAAYPD